jgi:hypothetical protein
MKLSPGVPVCRESPIRPDSLTELAFMFVGVVGPPIFFDFGVYEVESWRPRSS